MSDSLKHLFSYCLILGWPVYALTTITKEKTRTKQSDSNSICINQIVLLLFLPYFITLILLTMMILISKTLPHLQCAKKKSWGEGVSYSLPGPLLLLIFFFCSLPAKKKKKCHLWDHMTVNNDDASFPHLHLILFFFFFFFFWPVVSWVNSASPLLHFL